MARFLFFCEDFSAAQSAARFGCGLAALAKMAFFGAFDCPAVR
jgi:hypothetical protein